MSRGCDDCGTPEWECFMLADELWLSIAPGDGLLCIACFERRLGRRLVRADFSAAQINVWFSAVPGPLQERYQPTPDEKRAGARRLLAFAQGEPYTVFDAEEL